MLREIERKGIGRCIGQDIAFLGYGFGEEFWHAVELGLYVIKAFGDADGVVEDGIGGVVSRLARWG